MIIATSTGQLHPRRERLRTAAAGALRPVKILLGFLFAAVLLALGLALLNDDLGLSATIGAILGLLTNLELQARLRIGLCLSVMAIAGAQVVFMVLVADDLCPFAPMEVTGFLKLSASLITWGALALAGLIGVLA